jgi:23S rRNA pseudouridine2605 synthase
VVSELGARVDPDQQSIRFDGVEVPHLKKLYFMVNKPSGVLSTNRDPDGRPRVIDLIDTDQRLFTIGRLDKSSEGLLIVTNDGELANQLTHPRYGAPKTYHVEVAGTPGKEDLDALARGVHLAEGFAKAVSVRVRREHKRTTVLEIVLKEGRNREIRRLLARIGHKVVRLKRTAIGLLKLGDLPLGAYRKLSAEEVKRLRQCASRPRRVRATASSSTQGFAKPAFAKPAFAKHASAKQGTAKPFRRRPRPERASQAGKRRGRKGR